MWTKAPRVRWGARRAGESEAMGSNDAIAPLAEPRVGRGSVLVQRAERCPH